MAPSLHDLALFTLTAGAAVGALLTADAADEALRQVPELKRRRYLPTGSGEAAGSEHRRSRCNEACAAC
jgi:hypothetical protein